jgi:hypothetical protein
MGRGSRSYAFLVADRLPSDQKISVWDFAKWLWQRPALARTRDQLWHKVWLGVVLPSVGLGAVTWYFEDYRGWLVPIPGRFHHITGPGMSLWYFIGPPLGLAALVVLALILANVLTAKMRAEIAAQGALDARHRALLSAIDGVRSDLTDRLDDLERQRQNSGGVPGGSPGPQIGQVNTLIWVAGDYPGGAGTQAPLPPPPNPEVTATQPPDQDDEDGVS